MSSLIIEYNQSTGLGDQYVCIYTLYDLYHQLKKNTNINILVYCNSETSFYFGYNPPGFNFYNQIFDYSFIEKNNLFFNTKIDKRFTMQKNWNNIFKFYSENDKDVQDAIMSLNIFLYSHENLLKLNNSHNPLKIDPLVNKDLLLDTLSKNKEEFIVCAIRLPDREFADDQLLMLIKEKIKKISTDYNNYKIIIGSRHQLFSEFEKNDQFIMHIEPSCSPENRVIQCAKDMIYMSQANKVYTYCRWHSNFITYSILHNDKNKHYSEFIEKLI